MACALLVGCGMSAGWAQQPADEDGLVVLEEVTVTARKREETVLQVPVSITAFTAEDIRKTGISTITDLSALAPGLSFQQSIGQHSGRNAGNIMFRGMAPTYSVAREQSGSLFIDGVYVSSGIASVDTTDVERIEVLRGPQNAYFGRSTFGGAINYITRNPGDTLAGGVTLGGATDDAYEFNANVEGPLIESKLAGRVSIVKNHRGGQYRANDGGVLGKEDTRSISATLYATPTDNLWIRFRAHVQRDEDGPAPAAFLSGIQYGSLCPGQTYHGATSTGDSVPFTLTRPYFCSSPPTLRDIPGIVSSNTSLTPAVLASIGRPTLFSDILLNNSLNNPLMDRAPRLDHMGLLRDLQRYSLQSEYTFDNGISLVLNLSTNKSESVYANDPDRSDAENTFSIAPSFTDDKYAEIRLQSAQDQRFRWLVGYSYFELENESQQIGYQINAARGAPLPTTAFQNARSQDKAEVPATFGALEFDLLDNLTVGGEVRRQTDKTIVLNTVPNQSVSYKSTLPRVFVKWNPLANTNLYATWGRGVMPGQLNGNVNTANAAQLAEICAVFPECGTLAPLPKVDNYEIGLKQRLLGGRLQYSLSAYEMKWKGINTSVTAFVSTAPFTFNVVAPNDATLRGIEFEAHALLTDAWTLDFTAALQDNKYDKFHNPTLATLTGGVSHFGGNETPKVPDVTASLSSGYRGRVDDSWSWYVRGDVIYTGKMWDSEANIFQLDARTRVNARFGFERESAVVEFYARNLFNDKHWDYAARTTSLSEPGALMLVPYPTPTSALTTVAGVTLNPPAKREIGMRVTYRF